MAISERRGKGSPNASLHHKIVHVNEVLYEIRGNGRTVYQRMVLSAAVEYLGTHIYLPSVTKLLSSLLDELIEGGLDGEASN